MSLQSETPTVQVGASINNIREGDAMSESNPGDIVLSPFMGIGSEGHVALQMGRKFVGIELKDSYYGQATRNLVAAELHQASDMFNESQEAA